ncbi:MAG: hypothetical protein J6U54_13425 [Clostridiales bacterium]|nr:hypothetical protein [Clostridiales bacterium]
MAKEINVYNVMSGDWWKTTEDAIRKNKEKVDKITNEVNEKFKVTGNYIEAIKMFRKLFKEEKV